MFSKKNILLGLCMMILPILGIVFLISLPDPLFDDPTSTVVEDRNGELLGAKIAADGQWRFPPTKEVPDRFARALICYEDRYFYLHPGVNPFSLTRALYQNIRAGKVVSGGSTLSMQVIRLSRKGRDRTFQEKLIEIFLALRLETKYDKSGILALYSSNAPFGGNVVGLEAAAWRYFGCPPDNLSWAEAAVLAVLPNSPALIHPGRNRQELKLKRDRLLYRLYQHHEIDSLTWQLSLPEPLPYKPHPLPSMAPHLLDRIYLTNPGRKTRTSLVSSYQAAVNSILAKHHKRLQANEIHNIACLVVSVDNGEILAYTGNVRDALHPEYGGEVDIISSPRSTGSILKPALYCMMLSHGEILPNTLFPDIPTHYSGYTPMNFSMDYDGAVPAKKALCRSLNIPAVRMLHAFGTERFHYLLRKMGITSLIYPASHYGLSLILGGAECSLLEVTGLYASFARVLNHHSEPGRHHANDVFMPSWTSQTDPEENKTINPPGKITVPAIPDAASVWLTLQALIEVNRPESEAGWELFSSSSKIAWKTGTSFGFRDAWAIGTNPSYSVGVWAGNADGEGRPGLTGLTAAAPVLFDVFDILPESQWFEPPYDEMARIEVCSRSGHRAGQYCRETDTVWIPLRGLNTPPCPYHTLVHLDQKGQYRVNSSCAPIEQIKHYPWFVLPPVQEWYYRRKNPDYVPLPPLHPDCAEDDIALIDLIYPKHTARIYIPNEMEGSRSNVIFEAAHRKPNITLYWHLDEQYLGSTSQIHQFGLHPDAGMHVLTLVDEFGNTFTRSFEIISR